MSAFAIEQFEKLAELTVASNDDPDRSVPWVFPNMANDGPVGVKSFGKQLASRPCGARIRPTAKESAHALCHRKSIDLLPHQGSDISGMAAREKVTSAFDRDQLRPRNRIVQ